MKIEGGTVSMHFCVGTVFLFAETIDLKCLIHLNVYSKHTILVVHIIRTDGNGLNVQKN